ncbi:SDR family NAD(P)-dependent oxidoreductase [Photobacterium damselae]
MMNKTALITGGATGIGKATAKKLISQGINVIISGRNIDKGAEVVKDIQKVATQGAIFEFIQNDVTDEKAVQAMINQIVEKFGQLDMAINNSGISNETASLNFSDSANFQAMLDTNVSGLYYCMKHEIVQMLKQGNGSIVNLASITGLNGMLCHGLALTQLQNMLWWDSLNLRRLIMQLKGSVLMAWHQAQPKPTLLPNNLTAAMKTTMKKSSAPCIR